jgi:GT2 family glycosyltransferase
VIKQRNPDISLVVASHARALRLRWLLNALEEQTLDRERWEVVVVHDNAGEETETLLRTHPLARAGLLRHKRRPAGTGTPAVQRNVGWREAKAPLVAFTDDDCRPAPHWLERMLAAAQAAPGQVVQGATRPDPYESLLLLAPRFRTLNIAPPSRDCPTCNIAYPRGLLEQVGGFDECFPGPAGEDTDLGERVRATGAQLIAVPDAVVYHAVEAYSLPGKVRLTWKWQHVPFVMKRHPQLRKGNAFERLFWKHAHWRLLLALPGLVGARRSPLALLLVAPYLRHALFVHGRRPRKVLRAVPELPSRAFIDGVEIATVTWGSIRHRTILL